MTVAEFVSTRLAAGALAVAFASSLAQSEMFTGDCGISPSVFHVLSIVLLLGGFLVSARLLIAPIRYDIDMKLNVGLALLYYTMCFLEYGPEITFADSILLEACLCVFLSGSSSIPTRLLLAKVVIGTGLGKLLSCGLSVLSSPALKYDALNQPFPFTTVWHLAQLPDVVVRWISVSILASELVLPVLLVVNTSSVGTAILLVCLCAYYAVIGNFGWVILALLACASRVVPDDIITLLVGETSLRRWGYQSTAKFDIQAAEMKVIKMAKDALLISFMLFVATLGLSYMEDQMHGIIHYLGPVVCIILMVASIVKVRNSRIGLIAILACTFLFRSPFSSYLTFGNLPYVEDFSGPPTCFVFSPGALGQTVHSATSRAGFLLQTKYSVMGTNTVGNNLGGTRYAELSVPGSVHGDETRPPFLLGHLPRLALKLWRIGTGRSRDVEEGLKLLRWLEQCIEMGSTSLRVFFTNADDGLLDALTANNKGNQVQSFYQPYQVTSRAADHQWWKRSYDNVGALPTKDIAVRAPSKVCKIYLPGKIMGVQLELILLSSVLCALILRLLFSSGKTSIDSKKKSR